MSTPSITNLNYKSVEISSLDGSKKIDLTNSILFADYFEDILSPCITMTLQISSQYSIFHGLPIRGGEVVTFNAETYSGEFKLDADFSLYVYKVSGIVADSSKEMFTLHLVSREGLTNETTRVQKKYQLKPINDHVTSILKDVLKTKKYKSENIERTSNSFSFIGTLKKPFTVLTWLGPKSIPSTSNSGKNGTKGKGVTGFLFYENKDGFNFRSIDSLVASTKSQLSSTEKENIPTYVYTQAINSDSEINNFSILNYSFEKNIDLMKSLRVGMYSNVTYFYDIHKNKIEGITYKITEEIKSKLGAEGKLNYPKEFGDRPSRILFRTSDIGVTDEAGDPIESGRDNIDMAKSFSRYNLLFTQSLNMVVPLNVNLKAGGLINAQFQKIDASKSGEVDEEQSGKYLIKELRHHFEGGQMVTSLKLVRDSYGLYGANQ
jgi:hypothetical protein